MEGGTLQLLRSYCGMAWRSRSDCRIVWVFCQPAKNRKGDGVIAAPAGAATPGLPGLAGVAPGEVEMPGLAGTPDTGTPGLAGPAAGTIAPGLAGVPVPEKWAGYHAKGMSRAYHARRLWLMLLILG